MRPRFRLTTIWWLGQGIVSILIIVAAATQAKPWLIPVGVGLLAVSAIVSGRKIRRGDPW